MSVPKCYGSDPNLSSNFCRFAGMATHLLNPAVACANFRQRLSGSFRTSSIGIPTPADRYACYSTDKQELTAQRRALIELGVPEDRIYTDRGPTGRNRDRPGLGHAPAAVGTGEYSISDLGKLFKVSRPTVYRTIRRGS